MGSGSCSLCHQEADFHFSYVTKPTESLTVGRHISFSGKTPQFSNSRRDLLWNFPLAAINNGHFDLTDLPIHSIQQIVQHRKVGFRAFVVVDGFLFVVICLFLFVLILLQMFYAQKWS